MSSLVETPPWLLSVVYGSPSGMLRDKLWEDLSNVKLHLEGPWMSISDYNAVISGNEVWEFPGLGF